MTNSMRRIKNELIARLMLQLRFTPQKHRRKQLEAAEKLYGIIDRDKEYPFDFICFRITGYNPKGQIQPARAVLIKGDQLLDDLHIFISRLSGLVAEPVAQQNQVVYTIEQLAEEFKVSTKTINRWRKKGLIARRFVFDDGVKRLGFLQSTVNKFVGENFSLITCAGSFNRLTIKEKQQIIKEAYKLAAKTTLSRYQIIEQLCAQTHRAHETIRYILLEHEKSHPDKPIFKKPCGVMSPAQAAELYKLYEQGVSATELTRCFDRCRSSIYRIVNQRRAKTLLTKTIEYVASDEFLRSDAREIILSAGDEKQGAKACPERPVVSEVEPSRGDETPLNRDREMELFRKFNYLKYLACTAHTNIKPTLVRSAQLTEIENYLAQAETIKKTIIEANLPLVVSIASKHTTRGVNLPDLISEGNLSLMQAVEKFDYTKGIRFSTYALWNMARDFARKIPAQSAKPDKQRAASLANIQRDLRSAAAVDFGAVEHARQSLAQVIKDELNEREQYVILNHFGLEGSPVKKNTKTLMQIGQELGLSKERIRQIELAALAKLRHRLSKKEFELLTG